MTDTIDPIASGRSGPAPRPAGEAAPDTTPATADVASGTPGGDGPRTIARGGTRRTILRRRRTADGPRTGVLRDDSGMSTVEYAIGTVAAAAFAAILYAVLSGDSIVTALTGIVQRALSTTF